VSRRADLKRKRILEERERNWKAFNLPVELLPDTGQDEGDCDCASGNLYSECCGTGDAKGTAIRGSFALKMIHGFYENPKCRNPREAAEKFLSTLKANHICVTTEANIRRAQKVSLDQNQILGELPPILYHATYADTGRHILAEGLKPRRMTGRDNYKSQDLSSHPDHVYMTEFSTMFYLARLACAVRSTTVLAIDTSRLDQSLLYPDEDYAALMLSLSDGGLWSTNREGRVKGVTVTRDNIEEHRHLWFASLKGFGNVAYRGIISPTAIQKAIPDLSGCISNFGNFTLKSDYLLAAYPFTNKQVKESHEQLLETEKLAA